MQPGPRVESRLAQAVPGESSAGFTDRLSDPGTWLPVVPPHAPMARLLAVLLTSSCACTVEEWAERAGYTRQHLCRICRGALGLSAKGVVLCRVRAHVDLGLAAGESLTTIAWRLGYSGASSLGRACARAQGGGRVGR